MILTIIDSTGIQDYIFSTNKLRQIIGASHLVNCTSRNWVKETLNEIQFRHNILDLDAKAYEKIFSNSRIEEGELDAEIIYAGGGNTLILFRDLSHAEKFTRQLTRRVITDSPGLRLAICHSEFVWQEMSLGGSDGILRQAFAQLARRKNQPSPVTFEPGWGVTVECSYTGLPAVDTLNHSPDSSEIKAKLAAEGEGNQRLMNLVNFRGFLEPHADFDLLGRSEGEKSLLAVVHTDGNAMGKRLIRIYEAYSQPDQNSQCVEALRRFSISIQISSLTALQATVDHLINNVAEDLIAGEIEVHEERLPFRPLIFGGDDLTFVCDGRLGLDLAAFYLQAAAKQELSDGGKLFCRAGVAIVKTHYPFARAYALAEELCQSSSRFIAETQQEITKALEDTPGGIHLNHLGMVAIDWHFAIRGVLDNLDDIRRREYTNKEGVLTMRPLSLACEVDYSSPPPPFEIKSSWRTWENFLEIIDQFQNDPSWVDRRNKIKALRQALREGKKSVQHFCINFNAKLPEVDENAVNLGWLEGDDHCAYFDAIEAMDNFIQLKQEG